MLGRGSGVASVIGTSISSVVGMCFKCLAKSVMLKDRDYDVTPYISAHILRQIRNGSAKSARYLIK